MQNADWSRIRTFTSSWTPFFPLCRNAGPFVHLYHWLVLALVCSMYVRRNIVTINTNGVIIIIINSIKLIQFEGKCILISYSPILDRSVYIFTQMRCFYYMFDRHVLYLCTYIAVYPVLFFTLFAQTLRKNVISNKIKYFSSVYKCNAAKNNLFSF
jgi:hypothetical protein